MRIFITGANGQLARSMSMLYPSQDTHLASRSTLDITDKRSVVKQISDFNPNIVFHFASMTRGDECAKNPEEAKRINFGGTMNVVNACLKTGASILFVSTNEVFDGLKKSPYTERSLANPITVVGKTKLLAENYIRENLKKYYIVRTSWLYSNWSANFLHAVMKKAKEGKEIELVFDEVGSPTYSSDLSDAIKKLVNTGKYGIYHLANEGSASRLEFAKKTFEHYSLGNVSVMPIALDKYKRISKPPKYSPLKNTRAKKMGISLPHWEDALKRFLSEHDLLS